MSCDQTCPTFFDYPTLSVSRIAGALHAKAKLLEHPNASIVACSGYASDAVKATLSARGLSTNAIRKKVHSVWLGADTEYYFLEAEKRRTGLRNSFRLPTGKLIVLLPSGNYNDRRKNVQAAWRIFCALAEDKFHAIILGETLVSPDLLGNNFTHLPYISDKARLSSLFRCSDFVINTSHDETFGQTIIEGGLVRGPAGVRRQGGSTRDNRSAGCRISGSVGRLRKRRHFCSRSVHDLTRRQPRTHAG